MIRVHSNSTFTAAACPSLVDYANAKEWNATGCGRLEIFENGVTIAEYASGAWSRVERVKAANDPSQNYCLDIEGFGKFSVPMEFAAEIFGELGNALKKEKAEGEEEYQG